MVSKPKTQRIAAFTIMSLLTERTGNPDRTPNSRSGTIYDAPNRSPISMEGPVTPSAVLTGVAHLLDEHIDHERSHIQDP